MIKRRINADELELEERVVQINRVSKVVKGGRRFSFSTVVVVGDGKEHVGIGMGKAAEVPEAIRKGVEAAKKNLIRVPLSGTTIPHEVQMEFAASRCACSRLLRAPASSPGAVCARCLRWQASKTCSKRYGSNNPINVVKATFKALSALTSLEEQARMRGMTPRELNLRRMRREPAPQEA